jgi:hypothetical protein
MLIPILTPLVFIALVLQDIQFIGWSIPLFDRADVEDLGGRSHLIVEMMLTFILSIFSAVYFPALIVSLIASFSIRRFHYLFVVAPAVFSLFYLGTHVILLSTYGFGGLINNPLISVFFWFPDLLGSN